MDFHVNIMNHTDDVAVKPSRVQLIAEQVANGLKSRFSRISVLTCTHTFLFEAGAPASMLVVPPQDT